MESLAEHNVTLFNEYVYEQLHALTARGKQTLDLLPNLQRIQSGQGYTISGTHPQEESQI
jgi:hypothetical protein